MKFLINFFKHKPVPEKYFLHKIKTKATRIYCEENIKLINVKFINIKSINVNFINIKFINAKFINIKIRMFLST